MTTPTTRTRTRTRKPFSNVRPEGTPTNKLGFPLARCTRCGGTGRYPSSAYRGICLGCSGTGRVDFSRSSRRQRLAYEAHVVETQTTNLYDLEVGDTVWTPTG